MADATGQWWCPLVNATR